MEDPKELVLGTRKPILAAVSLFLAGPFLLSIPTGDPLNPALFGMLLLLAVWVAAFFSFRRSRFTLVHGITIVSATIWVLTFLILLSMSSGGMSMRGAGVFIVGGIGFILLLIARALLLRSRNEFEGANSQKDHKVLQPVIEEDKEVSRWLLASDREIILKLRSVCLAYEVSDREILNDLEPIAVLIGKELDRRGGLSEMRRVRSMLGNIGGSKELEICWNGIGEWCITPPNQGFQRMPDGPAEA